MKNKRPTAREWREALKQCERRQPRQPPQAGRLAEKDVSQMQSRKATATVLILAIVPAQILMEVIFLAYIPDDALTMTTASKVATLLAAGIAYIRWAAATDRNLEKIHGGDKYMKASAFWLILPWVIPVFNLINAALQMRRLARYSNPEGKDSTLLLGLWLGFTIFAGVSTIANSIYPPDASIQAAATAAASSYGPFFISAAIWTICMARVTKGTTGLAPPGKP